MITELLLATGLGAACGGAVDTGMTLVPGTLVEFVDANAELDVRGETGDRLRVIGTLPAGACLEFIRDRGAMTIRIRRNNTDGGPPARISIVATVPAGSPVKIGVTDGAVHLRGLDAGAQVTTVYAPITAREVRGDVRLRAVEALVSAEHVGGKVYLRSTAKDVRAESIDGDLTIESVSGTMRVGGAMPRTITSSTWGGTIAIDGLPPAGGRFELTTHSGNVRILLPVGGSASFEVTTWEAQVRSSVQLTQRTKGEVRRGSIGRADGISGIVAISSVQGRIEILSRGR